MEPVEEPPRKISKLRSEDGKEKNDAPSKLTTIDASQLEAISQKDKPQPTVTNVFCRPHPVSPFQPASSRAESSCVGSQLSVRGNVHHMPLNGHAFVPPHSCYGHFPPYRGFLSNSFTEYLALGLYQAFMKILSVFFIINTHYKKPDDYGNMKF